MILEYSSFSANVPPYSNCRLTIASSDSSRQVQVRFRYLNIPKTTGCVTVGLKLSEGGVPLTRT